MIYKPTDNTWKDETGNSVPYTRTTAVERRKEKEAAILSKIAVSLSNDLIAFKIRFGKACDDIFEQAMKAMDADAKKAKGNFTWYNFDRSIKVEKSINERIDFDDAAIAAAKIKLNEYLDKNLSETDEALRGLINSAFETSKGKLDAKKVLSLLKHKQRIKSQDFQDAMNLIEQSIRRPDSKTYYRISERQENGDYKVIDLNFSSL